MRTSTLTAVQSVKATPDSTEGLLRAILAAINENTAAVRGLSFRKDTQTALSRADLARLGRLLPAIAGALGSEQFTSRDLAADSAPGLRLVLRKLSVKQIGRLLARADGVPIDGWLVERCGVEINVTLWRVVAAVSHRLESGTG